MNGENYHQIGSLLPQPEKDPKFAQLYIQTMKSEIAYVQSGTMSAKTCLVFPTIFSEYNYNT